MPSRKTFIVLILCAGVVTSVWLLLQIPVGGTGVPQNINGVVSVDTYRNIDLSSTTDWQKILVSANLNDKPVTDLTNQSASVSDDTTLTAQMARDFFSQYLLLKKGGQAITPGSVNVIVQNTLSLPAYTKSTGAVYTLANLHISQNADTATVKKYLNDLNLMIKNRKINENDDDPIVIVGDAKKTEDENGLKKLDPIILKAKGIISDLLVINVPADAGNLHLNLLNSASNMLSNLEAMRVMFSDPIRSLSGTSEYTQHIVDLQNALKNLNSYFKQKLGTSQ